jgi:ankyrin repeat protein
MLSSKLGLISAAFNLKPISIPCSSNVSAMTSRQQKALWEAVQYNKVKEIKKQVKRGANVTILNKEGESCIHWAVGDGHLDAVRTLIELGADVNIPAKRGGVSPIQIAAGMGNEDMVKLLLQFGATIDMKDTSMSTPIHAAASAGHNSMLNFLAERGADISSGDAIGQTPMHKAAIRGYSETLIALAKLGADVNAPRLDGVRPIHLAAEEGHIEVVATLARLGADCDISCGTQGDIAGMRPIHMAAIKGHVELIRALYKLGADLSHPQACTREIGSSDFGMSSLAIINGHTETARFIEQLVKKLKKKQCAHCKVSPMRRKALRRCSACMTMTTLYCSVDCQRRHHEEHKPQCQQYQEENVVWTDVDEENDLN